MNMNVQTVEEVHYQKHLLLTSLIILQLLISENTTCEPAVFEKGDLSQL